MNTRIIAILVLFTLFLCSMIGVKQWTLNSGTPVLLETQPIDPRSLFRGDYVRLNYTINQLTPSELDGDNDFQRYDKIYVELQQQEKYWQPIAIHHDRPTNGKLALAGKIQYVNKHTFNSSTRKTEDVTTLRVKYGIENYFVPEGEGLELERRNNDQIVDIRVAIDKFCKAGIKEVLVNDQVRYTEKLF